MARVTYIHAVASRDPAKAAKLAEITGARMVYHDYQSVLLDPDVTHIYVGVPTTAHRQWAENAIAVGKTVLCEKPYDLPSDDSAGWLREPLPSKLLVAWMYRHHGRWQAVHKMVSAGAIGEPLSMTFYYSYRDNKSNPRRWSRSAGGGALALVGSYGVHIAQSLFGPLPSATSSSRSSDEGEVDAAFAATLTFGRPVATVLADLRSPGLQYVGIAGTEGSVFLDRPINPGPDEVTTIVLRDGQASETLAFSPCDQFAEQALWASQSGIESSYADRHLDLIDNPRLLSRLLFDGR